MDRIAKQYPSTRQLAGTSRLIARSSAETGPGKALHKRSVGTSIAGRNKGFTLLEILLVLTIIGMASVLVVPNLTGMEARTFTAQFRQANSMLNYGRRIAVVSGQASTVSLHASGERNFDTEQDDDPAIELGNIVGHWDAAGIELRFRDSTDKEVEVEGKIDITFYPEGGSSGGTLLFSEDERLATIVIDPFTGRISSVIGEG